MQNKHRGLICVVMSMLVSAASMVTVSAESNAISPDINEQGGNKSSYNEYIAGLEHDGCKEAESEVKFGIRALSNLSSANIKTNYNGSGRDAVVMHDSDTAAFEFNITDPGFYRMEIDYMPASEGSGNIELDWTVDGNLPFEQSSSLMVFPRRYKQNNEFETNLAGNERKPEVTEVFEWSTYALSDAAGYVAEPYKIFFSAGKHTLSLSGSRGTVAIAEIRLCPPDNTPSYEDYIKAYKANGAKESDCEIKVYEAEKLLYKSHQTIFPVTDKSSPETSPQSAAVLMLNSVGGENYQNIGEQIAWQIEVDETGFYKIGFRFKQSLSDGIFTSRKLYVDGVIPFKEAEGLRFMYDSAWQNAWIGGDGDPYLIYLEAGSPHILTLEVTMGDLAVMIGGVSNALTEMNNIYRRIISITGPSPDKYRDYGFAELIPNEIKRMGEIANELQSICNNVDAAAGKGGSYTSVIKKIIFELDEMGENPRKIAKFLEQFKANLGSLGTWLLNAQKQPLQLDKVFVGGTESVLPKSEAGFFGRIAFGIKNFYFSFLTDYSSIGASDKSSYKDSIKVWIQTGRDQAEILRNLIDTKFVSESKTNVTLELVASGSLLVSVLSGNAPDVCLNNAMTEPINYAVRGAAMDLTGFKDFDSVASAFHKSALEPYTFRKKTYGLPETFSFQMFFYRTDIFKEMGLEEPRTWQDLLDLIPELQSENTEMGIPHDLNAYAMILYQNGGTLYTNDGEETNIGSNEGLNSFVELTELFTLYDLPPTFDFANRFRSGEMACGIQDYTMYNQLIAFAPEIRGNWKMIPVPGKPDKDGNPRHVSVGTGTAAMILTTTKNPEKSWEFLKWYLDSDIQSTFAIEMESLLGPSAKYATANIEALKKMTWSRDEYNNLLTQMDTVMAVPQVPGGYYLQRVLNFAFNRVYNSSGEQTMAENPVEVLTEYIPELNQEIEKKRKELLRE